MKQFLTSKWLIAFILTIPVLMVLPKEMFKKYTVEFVRDVNVEATDGIRNYFEDLNGDGKHERILSLFYSQHLSFIVYDHLNQMHAQTNFNGTYNEKLNRLYFYDTDRNGQKEIYGFSISGDSLYLNGSEPFSEESEIQSYFISKVGVYGDHQFDIQVPMLNCLDMDNDGNNEIVFILHNGFSKLPRQIIVLHPEIGKIEKSENIGACLSHLRYKDIDGDGKIEIICGTRATNNFSAKEKIKYKDDWTWLIAFDDDLSLLFDPLKIQKGIGSRFKPFIDETDPLNKEIVGFAHSVAPGNKCCLIYRFSKDGVLLDSTDINYKEKNYSEYVIQQNDILLAQLSKDKVLSINLKSSKTNSYSLLPGRNLYWRYSETFGDNKNPVHFAWETSRQKLHLFSDNFKHHNEIQLDQSHSRNDAVCKFDGTDANIAVTLKDKTAFYRYARNPFYELKYLIWIGTYLIVTLIVLIIQKLQEKQIKERYELQNKVRELQLTTFRNQLHPHFIFNTFNSIISVVMQGRKEEAYDLFSNFMKVLRTSLNNTESVLVKLEEELTLVRHFVEIQQFRFKDLFDFQIILEDDVSIETFIPKMIIQIHVENAIKHGIRPKKKEGILKIHIYKPSKRELAIEIIDNGIGRKKSKEENTGGTGLGLKTIDQFIKQVNAGKEMQVKQEIVDLIGENGAAVGTKVVVIVKQRVLPHTP